jgi:hypothetical protein
MVDNNEMGEDTVSLRQYVDTNFELRDRALKIQQEASEQALLLATRTLETRLAQLNELRSEVTSDRSNFITRVEFAALVERVGVITNQYVTREMYDTQSDSRNKRIEALERWQAKLVGIGIILVLLAGVIGAGIMKLFGV